MFGVGATHCSLRRLVLRRDGLHGADHLPGAVRKPLPARPAGEVQGLAARRRLGADAAARPDGRLPARLPRPLAGAGHPVLLALPARGARDVGLLRDDDAGWLARDARQRTADPQDALPAPARRVRGRRHESRDVCRDARDPARTLLRIPARLARNGVARTAARGALRLLHRGPRSDDRVAERPLPRRRALGWGLAPAVVLPDAGPLLVLAVPPPHDHPGVAVRESGDA